MQSAASPNFSVEATLGAKSLPIFVAGNSKIFGLCFRIILVRMEVYISVLYSLRASSSAINILFAPKVESTLQNFLISLPIITAQISCFNSFASSFALPSNSKVISLISLFLISANTHTS